MSSKLVSSGNHYAGQWNQVITKAADLLSGNHLREAGETRSSLKLLILVLVGVS